MDLMNKPDNSSQSTENTCVATPIVRTLATEQLCEWLRARRRFLKKERIAVLGVADRLNQELNDITKLLDLLTTR